MMLAMQVPLVDLQAQYAAIRTEIGAAIARVLEAQSFILGPEVRDFEERFAAYAGAREAAAVSSGTAALHLALRACEVGEGHEVIIPAHTFAATAEAVLHAGARPVFADVDEQTHTLDPAAVAAAITPRTRALIPVHLYGHPAPLPALRGLADAHGLKLIEDAAQAHGAELGGRRCGSLGDLACFSFYPGKNLGAYGDAGMVTGNDPELVERVRRLRNHGRTGKYEHLELGYGERMDALQAAVLGVKLTHLDAWTEARRERAERYRRLLGDSGLGLPEALPEVRHVYHLFVVRSPRRDALLAGLRERGIGAGVHYPIPLHRQPAFAPWGAGCSLPVTERLAGEVLSLPLYPELSDAQQDAVVAALGELLT